MLKLLKDYSSIGIIQIANYVLPLVYVPIISRIIGPEKYGVINFAAAFIGYFTLFINYGFDLSATRKVARDPGNVALRNDVFNEVLNSQFLLFLASILFFGVCFLTIKQFSAERLVAMFTFLTCIGTLLTQNWVFQAMHDMPKLAILSFVSRIILTLSVLVFIRHQSEYPYLALVTSLTNIVVSLVCFIWAKKRYNLVLRLVPVGRSIRHLVEERSVFFSTVMIGVYNNTNIVLLGLVVTPLALGYYTSGQRLIGIVHMIVTAPLTLTLYPYIGKEFGKGIDSGISVLQKLFPIIVIFLACVGVVIFFSAPLLVHFFYGDRYLPTIGVLRVLAFVPFFIAMNNFFGMYVMLNLKMDKPYFRIILGGTVISVIGNLAFVHFFGYIGAAMNWLFTEMLISSSMCIYLYTKGHKIIKRGAFHPSLILSFITNKN